MKKIGWIIYNGNLASRKFIDYATMLHQAANKKNSRTKIFKNTDLLAILDGEQLNMLIEPNTVLPDYVLFTDKDLYLAKQFELLGVPVFNSAQAIEISDDKIATYQHLAMNKLPIPKTIISPKVFVRNESNPSYPNLENIIDTLGFPMIVKESFGSFGEQVYLVHSIQELQDKIDELQGKPFMFQEFIQPSYGKDMRIQVVGDQVVAAMKRKAKNDFRANVTAGGTMEAYLPSETEKELAIKATKALGADFAGVDLLFGNNQHEALVCEVNSNAHIRNLLDCTGINVADYIMEYVLTVINKGGSDEQ